MCKQVTIPKNRQLRTSTCERVVAVVLETLAWAIEATDVAFEPVGPTLDAYSSNRNEWVYK